MPLLNATGAPYTGVPTVSTPPDAGGQTQRISADASMFGGLEGQATSQLGRTLESAGDQFAQIAIQRQEIYNKMAATESGNALTDNWSKILTGDPNDPNDHGYYGTTGRAAGDEFPKARDKIDAAFTEARSKLQNPQQQLLFDAEMRRQRAYNLGLMGRHYDQEYKKYTESTYKGAIRNAEGGVATAAANNDPHEWERALGSQMKLIIDQGKALNRPQEEIDADLHEARSNAVHVRVATLAAQDRPGAAFTLLENNHDAIGGPHSLAYAQLLSSIKKAVSDEQIRAARGKGPMPPWQPPGGMSYQPSSDILTGTGLSSDEYQTFRGYLASREQGSQGYATPPNVQGHYGKYQFGDTEVKETAARLGVPMPSRQDFLNNPTLQEKFLENYTLDHHNQLMQKSAKYRDASPAEKAGILMGAHLGGVGGVMDYLTGKGDPEDTNHTRVSDYVNSMKQAIGAKPKAPEPQKTSGTNPAASTKISGIPTNLRAVGDSLAVQLVNSGVAGAIDKPSTVAGQPITPGMSAGGNDQPDRILARMKGLPDDFYKGNIVFLTSGSNMPSKIGYVQDQIALAREKNAAAVLVPALGPGIKGRDRANDVLRYFAAEKGAIFFEPKIEWDAAGVHPKNATEVAKFRQQGLDALAAAQGPRDE